MVNKTEVTTSILIMVMRCISKIFKSGCTNWLLLRNVYDKLRFIQNTIEIFVVRGNNRVVVDFRTRNMLWWILNGRRGKIRIVSTVCCSVRYNNIHETGRACTSCARYVYVRRCRRRRFRDKLLTGRKVWFEFPVVKSQFLLTVRRLL